MALAVYDSSVVIALLDTADAHHVEASKDLAARIHHSTDVVLPTSAYAEILVRPARAGEEAIQAVRRFCRKRLRFSNLEPETAEVAAKLRAAHKALRLPDALILATAQVLRADAVVTADAAWTKYADNVVVLGRDIPES